MAISAPVLPAEKAASASFFFTASRASHMEEARRPARKAWLGLSSMRTAIGVWRTVETAMSAGSAESSGLIFASSEKGEGHFRTLDPRQSGPRHNDLGAV